MPIKLLINIMLYIWWNHTNQMRNTCWCRAVLALWKFRNIYPLSQPEWSTDDDLNDLISILCIVGVRSWWGRCWNAGNNNRAFQSLNEAPLVYQTEMGESIDFLQMYLCIFVCCVIHSSPHFNINTVFPDMRIRAINSLRPSDAYMRQLTNNHWFR